MSSASCTAWASTPGEDPPFCRLLIKSEREGEVGCAATAATARARSRRRAAILRAWRGLRAVSLGRDKRCLEPHGTGEKRGRRNWARELSGGP